MEGLKPNGQKGFIEGDGSVVKLGRGFITRTVAVYGWLLVSQQSYPIGAG